MFHHHNSDGLCNVFPWCPTVTLALIFLSRSNFPPPQFHSNWILSPIILFLSSGVSILTVFQRRNFRIIFNFFFYFFYHQILCKNVLILLLKCFSFTFAFPFLLMFLIGPNLVREAGTNKETYIQTCNYNL